MVDGKGNSKVKIMLCPITVSFITVFMEDESIKWPLAINVLSVAALYFLYKYASAETVQALKEIF